MGDMYVCMQFTKILFIIVTWIFINEIDLDIPFILRVQIVRVDEKC